MSNVFRFCFLFLLLGAQFSLVNAQNLDIPNVWIAKFKQPCKQLTLDLGCSYTSTQLDRKGLIWKITLPNTANVANINLLKSTASIQFLQPNYGVINPLRGKPTNDTYYDTQWWADQISLPDAWEFTTGGVTPNGDTIVVAIIDAGFDIYHEDLVENVWVNRAEIAYPNGIDDDGNGYTDDINGWNVAANSDAHPVHPHGTNMAGVIAAKGNNDLGLSGVNWDVKWMPLSGILSDADIYAAADYIAAMRSLYEETNGEKGAFVVSVNISLGISGGKPEEHPIWCEAIALLGEHGIITVGAAPNTNFNIDEYGDIPCTCPNNALIAVTSSTKTDYYAPNAAYGPINVDITAPGVEIASTGTLDTYRDDITGTSMTAPQVAGAVALLYSMPFSSAQFVQWKSNPNAYLDMKTWILDGVAKNEALSSRVVSGGRLDVYGAMLQMIAQLGQPLDGALSDFDIKVFPNPCSETQDISVQMLSNDILDIRIVAVNALGQQVFSWEPTPEDWLKNTWILPSEQLSNAAWLYVVDKQNPKNSVSKALLRF